MLTLAFSVKGAMTRPMFAGDNVLVFGERDKIVFVDLGSRRRHEGAPHSGPIVDVATAPGGHAASLSASGTLTFWDTASGKPVRSLRLRAKMGGGLALAPDLHYAAALPAGPPFAKKKLTMYDLRTGKALFVSPWAEGGAFSPNGKTFACGGMYRAYLWDMSTCRKLREEPVYEGSQVPFAFSSEGNRIYSIRDCQKPLHQAVEALNPGTLAMVQSYTVNAAEISSGFLACAAASSDGRFVVTGRTGESPSGSLPPFSLWDAASGKTLADGKGPEPQHVALSATGRWLASQVGTRIDLWQLI